MNYKIDDNWEYRWPEWVVKVSDRIYEDFLDGRIAEEAISPAVAALGMLEIDKCPTPLVSYFRDDIMFTWDSLYGCVSLVVDDAWGSYKVWMSRNGFVSRDWEFVGVAGARKAVLGIFPSIRARWSGGELT